MNRTLLLPGLALAMVSLCPHGQAAAQAMWTQKASIGAGAVTEARAFAINGKGYIGAATPDLWEYDPVTDAWTQKAAFIGPTRTSAAGFAIGNTGYFGTGGSYKDFYAYDATANAWTQKTNFGGSAREGAVGCAVNGKGYIGLGGSYLNDWWEYDPATDAWTQKANLAGPGRYHAGAFSIGNKAYVSCGFNGSFMNDCWEYDPAANTWTARASKPGPTLDRPVGLAAGGKGYILTGWTGGTALQDAWEYDPGTNSWTAIPSFGGTARYNACGFVIGAKLYVGTGYANGPAADLWAYGNDCNVLASATTTSCAGNCDGLATVDNPAPGAAAGYLWSTGATTQSIMNLCAGTYTVSVTDTSGCSAIVSVYVGDPSPVTATFTGTPPVCYGDTNGMICAVPSGGIAPYTAFQWSTGDTSACTQPVAAGTYSVTITDSSGCSGTATYTLNQPNPILVSFLSNDATCPTCANGYASAVVSGGAVPYSYNWSNGGTLVFISNLLPGTYTCCVTDGNGCQVCDSVVIQSPVGTGEPLLPEPFAAWPNPFDDTFGLAWPASESGQVNVVLYDALGRPLPATAERQGGWLNIQVPRAAPGVYSVKLVGSGRTACYRVIKR